MDRRRFAKNIFLNKQRVSHIQLYLESGHIPARFVIKRMKIIFFRYTMTQKEDSLIYRFLMAQKQNFKKGDWYSDVSAVLKEFDMEISEEDMQ